VLVSVGAQEPGRLRERAGVVVEPRGEERGLVGQLARLRWREARDVPAGAREGAIALRRLVDAAGASGRARQDELGAGAGTPRGFGLAAELLRDDLRLVAAADLQERQRPQQRRAGARLGGRCARVEAIQDRERPPRERELEEPRGASEALLRRGWRNGAAVLAPGAQRTRRVQPGWIRRLLGPERAIDGDRARRIPCLPQGGGEREPQPERPRAGGLGREERLVGAHRARRRPRGEQRVRLAQARPPLQRAHPERRHLGEPRGGCAGVTGVEERLGRFLARHRGEGGVRDPRRGAIERLERLGEAARLPQGEPERQLCARSGCPARDRRQRRAGGDFRPCCVTVRQRLSAPGDPLQPHREPRNGGNSAPGGYCHDQDHARRHDPGQRNCTRSKRLLTMHPGRSGGGFTARARGIDTR